MNASAEIKVNQPDLFEKGSTYLRIKPTGISWENIKSIKWFKNNNQIEKEKEIMLKLTNLTHFHNGLYQCVIELSNSQQIFSNALDLKINCK